MGHEEARDLGPSAPVSPHCVHSTWLPQERIDSGDTERQLRMDLSPGPTLQVPGKLCGVTQKVLANYLSILYGDFPEASVPR